MELWQQDKITITRDVDGRYVLSVKADHSGTISTLELAAPFRLGAAGIRFRAWRAASDTATRSYTSAGKLDLFVSIVTRSSSTSSAGSGRLEMPSLTSRGSRAKAKSRRRVRPTCQ